MVNYLLFLNTGLGDFRKHFSAAESGWSPLPSCRFDRMRATVIRLHNEQGRRWSCSCVFKALSFNPRLVFWTPATIFLVPVECHILWLKWKQKRLTFICFHSWILAAIQAKMTFYSKLSDCLGIKWLPQTNVCCLCMKDICNRFNNGTVLKSKLWIFRYYIIITDLASLCKMGVGWHAW